MEGNFTSQQLPTTYSGTWGMLWAEARLALKETSMSAKLGVAALLLICVTASAQCNLAPITNRCHASHNVGMDAGEQLAAEILDAIRFGRDLWVFDQFIEGPDRLERARKVLIEKRDARSDADGAAFLTSIIRGLEKG